MSTEFATYSFLPWLRTGMASEIARRDGTLTGAPRADVPITVELSAEGDPREATAALALYGPGEVGGIDPRVVIRMAPQPGATSAVPNELPMAELDQPDFPWRYTPATADAKVRLRPWLVLAVLADDEILEDTPAGADGQLPALTVSSAAALPRLDQSWAWTHVQVEAFDAAAETLEEVVRDEPTRVRARLLAPRRLDPNRSYTAVLVPAFERGRLAGLREPVGEEIDGLAEAWEPDATDIRLPAYHRWSFRTGVEGDFEQLAQRLTAYSVTPDVGVRDLDVRAPDPALPPASKAPLPMQGALVAPNAQPGRWDGAARDAFLEALAAMLNAPADALEAEGAARTVAPPLWGRWHAARDRLEVIDTARRGKDVAAVFPWPPPMARPLWFHELNGDPRLRATAGLGAQLVRRYDQQLMAAAWDQVQGIIDANEALRRAQLAREGAAKLHANHFAPLDTDTFLEVTAPLHAHFTAQPATTVRRMLAASPIPDGTLDGQFRRLRRNPRGAGGQRARAGRSPLLARLNRGELRARPPVPAPAGMLVLERVLAEAVRRPGERPRRPGERPRRPGPAPPAGGRLMPPDGLEPPATWHPGVASGLLDPASEAHHTPVPVGGDPTTDPAAAAAVHRFQLAFEDFAGQFEAAPQDGPVWHEADLPAIGQTLLEQMDPRVTIADALTARLTIAPWVTRGTDDPLEPVMAAPEFDRPMYQPLRDLGQEWLLSGAGSIPPDTVSLVESNQRFIEAFMLGLSHELARELLYHEYPTDQRGTYFRQFWDSRGHVTAGGGRADAETLRDITPITSWEPAAGLGANSGRVPEPPQGNLVLLIRGELLRRYPNTLVYAVQTVLDEDGNRTLGTAERHPIFSGRLDPDISFFGFDLVADDVRGATGPGSETSPDQGWYFVLSEHPSEPRFGLDADDGAYGARPGGWRDLNWAQTAATAEELAAIGYLDLDADLPDTSGIVPVTGDPELAWHAGHGLGPKGANGSDLAWITFQRPFRVAIHGSDMLTEEA